eukprot:jgi/Galph1/4715/GphlegSOOS_G3392.1
MLLQPSEESRCVVQETWQKLDDIQDEIGEVFYDNLFANHPSLRDLFPSDMTKQKKLLVHMVDKGVKLLRDKEKLEPALQQLGKRHKRYSVQVEHFDVIKENLVYVLEYFLRDSFDEKTKKAWSVVYDYWAEIMIAGMKQEEPYFVLFGYFEAIRVVLQRSLNDSLDAEKKIHMTTVEEPVCNLYRSVGFRRLRRIVNEIYLRSFEGFRHSYSEGLGEPSGATVPCKEDFRVSWKNAFDEVVTNSRNLMSFEPFRNVTEEEEKRILLALELKQRRQSKRTRRSQTNSTNWELDERLRLATTQWNRVDKRIRPLLVKNSAVTPLVVDIESQILALYPHGGYLYIETSFERLLAHGIAQFHGMKSYSRRMENNENVFIVEQEDILSDKSKPQVYLSDILSTSVESPFK